MIDCTVLESISTSANLVQNCDVIASGALRLLTPFMYPDGSQIDLFIEEPGPLFKTRILSDLGQTTSYLLDLQVKPWASNKRRQIIEDVCRSLEVEWRGGRFQIELGDADMEQLSSCLLRLAQACIRVSDLAFSARLWSAGSFRDEIEEFLHSLELQFETNAVELNKTNKEVKFDFRVFGESTVSLIQSLSAASAPTAHSIAAESFIRWYDMGLPKKGSGPQHVTIIDESNDVFKEDDVSRLERFSTVLWFPADQEQLVATLKA
jgi:hypothetical protein